MSETLELVYNGLPINVEIELPGSKSLSNRILMLEYFSGNLINGKKHSASTDTINLRNILSNLPAISDAGEGGTTSRFALTALANTPGYNGVLKGSYRLSQRPISELVEALRKLGADLTYLENENQLPIQINGKKLNSIPIELNGSISSQFISALLLLGTSLNNGIEITVKGKLVSRPYLDMSIELLRQIGFEISINKQVFTLKPQVWLQTDFTVEKDWSSASYWYSLVALSPKSKVH